MLTENNWTHARYLDEDQDLMALVTLGADPENPEEILYFATVLQREDVLITQHTFSDLTSACQDLNLRFRGHWKFTDLLKPKKSGSCSTCQAH